MKITHKISNNSLSKNYDHIIAWGCGPLFRAHYDKSFFPLDYIIDGTGKQVGEKIYGIEVLPHNELTNLDGKTLVVIYTIYEAEILQQISHLSVNVDTIVYSLIEISLDNNIILPESNAKYAEDMLLLKLLRQLEISELQYIEIGVCHPIMRNNTFLFHQLFSNTPNYKGVLVEANPICWPLIEEYRPNDFLIKKGVSTQKGELPFYVFPNLLGYSTFVPSQAEKTSKRGYQYSVINVETDCLNNIISDYFNRTPDLLALDAEGLDSTIIEQWGYIKYPFKVIIVEYMDESEFPLKETMTKRGYHIYATTRENMIWVRNDAHVQV